MKETNFGIESEKFNKASPASNETKEQSYLVSSISRSAEIQVGTNQGNTYRNELHVVSTGNDQIHEVK